MCLCRRRALDLDNVPTPVAGGNHDIDADEDAVPLKRRLKQWSRRLKLHELSRFSNRRHEIRIGFNHDPIGVGSAREGPDLMACSECCLRRRRELAIERLVYLQPQPLRTLLE